MKKTICLLLTVLICSLFAESVDEILDKMEKNENPKSTRSEMTQIVYSPSGRETKSKLISMGKDEGDKGLMEYVSPARIKGMKILMLNDGDDIWLYSNRTGRVRKIASNNKKQSVNGSDFSYEDMSMGDMREDYSAKLAGNEKYKGKDCYKIVMTAKDKEKTYSKVVIWVDKSNYVYQKGDFYDEDGELWKTLTMEDVTKVAAYWTPKKIEMKNVQKGSRTVMLMNKIEYDIKLNDRLFSQKNLKR